MSLINQFNIMKTLLICSAFPELNKKRMLPFDFLGKKKLQLVRFISSVCQRLIWSHAIDLAVNKMCFYSENMLCKMVASYTDQSLILNNQNQNC